ncbi:MAG: hypothetical protein ACRC7O_14405, partial [Fimbriiglobus sp.]
MPPEPELTFYHLATLMELYAGFDGYCAVNRQTPGEGGPGKTTPALALRQVVIPVEESAIRDKLAEAGALVECPLVTAARILNDPTWPPDATPAVIGATYLIDFRDRPKFEKFGLYRNFKTGTDGGGGFTFLCVARDSFATVIAHLYALENGWPADPRGPEVCAKHDTYKDVYDDAARTPASDRTAFVLSGHGQVEWLRRGETTGFTADPVAGFQRWFYEAAKAAAISAGLKEQFVDFESGVPGSLL